MANDLTDKIDLIRMIDSHKDGAYKAVLLGFIISYSPKNGYRVKYVSERVFVTYTMCNNIDDCIDFVTNYHLPRVETYNGFQIIPTSGFVQYMVLLPRTWIGNQVISFETRLVNSQPEARDIIDDFIKRHSITISTKVMPEIKTRGC